MARPLVDTSVDTASMPDESAGGGVRTGVVKVALALTYLAAATNPWNGWSVGVGRPGDTFLILALVAFLFADAGRHWPSLPRWVWQFGGVIVLVTALHEFFPVSKAYLENRLLLGPSGLIVRGDIEAQSNLFVGIKFLIPVLGLPLMFAFARMHDSRALLRSALSFAVGAAVSAAIGFSDLIGVTHLSASITGIGVFGHRAPGLSLHPNFLAMTCVLSVPVLLWQLVSVRGASRVAVAVLLVLMLLGVYASGSRAGAAVAVGAVALSVGLIPAYRRLLPTVALIFVAVSAVAFVIKPGLGAAVLQAVRLSGDTGSAQGSDEQRAILHAQGRHDFAHSPFDGIGLQVAEEAHNVYLQALAAGGLLLLVGYLVFVAGGLLRAVRLMRHEPLAHPLIVTVVAGALFLVVQAALTDRVAYLWLALVAVLPTPASLHEGSVAEP